MRTAAEQFFGLTAYPQAQVTRQNPEDETSPAGRQTSLRAC